MAGNLGSLVVSLGLDAVGFTSGLTKAEYEAKKSLDNIAKSAQSLQHTIHDVGAALGIGFGVHAFVDLIKSTIEAADHLENLSKATGVSVEQLGGLGFAAKQTGGDLDSMADSFKRFSVNAASAAAGNEKNQEVFAALGISLKDLQTLSPDKLFLKAADAFASFNEGVNKSALGAAAFGKSYQGIIPTLDQGAQKLQENIEYFNRFGGVTTDVARQASEFNAEMVKLSLLGGSFGRSLTSDLLPPMKVLIEYLLNLKENSDLYAKASNWLAGELTADAVTILRIAQAFERLQLAMSSASEKIERFKQGDFSHIFSSHPDELAGIDAINKKYDDLINKVKTAKNSSGPDQVIPYPDGKRDPPGLTRGAGGQDAAKAQLAADLAVLQAYVKSEQELLKNRQSFLQDYYQHGEISIEDFYQAQQDVIAEALQKQQDAFAKEAALIAARNRVAGPTERAENEKKLTEILAQQARVQQEAAAASVKGFIDQSRAAEAFKTSIEQVALTVIALRGTDAVGSAIAAFDLQNRALIEQIALEKKSNDERIRGIAEIGDKYINELRQRVAAQAALNDAQQKYSNILDAVSIRLARIDLGQQTGALTEIDAINARARAAAESIGELTTKLAKYQEEARNAPEGPIKDAAIANVERMKLQIDQLAAATDVLAKKFNDIFAGAIADGITELVSGTKSLKDALNDVGKSITTQITQIASKQIAETLFAKGGPLGGVGNLFAGLFGGGNKDTGAAALVTAGTTLNASGAALTSSAAALTSAAAVLASSSGSNAVGSLFGGGGGFGTGDAFGNLDLGGFFAGGGNPPVGFPSVVGENGPELFIPKTSGTIVPNDVLVSRRNQRQSTYNISVSVMPGASRASADQAAAAIGREVRRAQARLD